MKPFKIKVLLTYVFYVITIITRNMRGQLLTFQNGVFSQDSFCSVNTRFYRKRVASGMILRLLYRMKAARMVKLTSLARAITWKDW